MAASIYVQSADGKFEGSGFFAGYQGRRWFITAAHVPIGSNDYHQDINVLPDEVAIFSGQERKDLALFDARDARKPLFVAHSHNGTFSDLICLPVSEDRIPESYMAHDLSKAWDSPMNKGDTLQLHGYPSRNGVNIWPETIANLLIVESNPDRHLTDGKVIVGFSGGVGIFKGRVAGMAIGNNNGQGVLISAGLIKRLLVSSIR